VSARDTLLQLGYVLIALGAVFATWALVTGPLGRWFDDGEPTRDEAPVELPPHAPEDGPRTGSNGSPS
jgi:hypothetical protein